MNYLKIWDSATGDDAFEARSVADGIRSVPSGAVKHFSFEHPCHSLPERRWFRSTVTPLTEDRSIGALVVRRDVTVEKPANDSLHASELRFRQMAENIREVFWLTDSAKTQMLYPSPAYEKIWGRSCESLYASPRDWIDAIRPEIASACCKPLKPDKRATSTSRDTASCGPTGRSVGSAIGRSRSFVTTERFTGSPSREGHHRAQEGGAEVQGSVGVLARCDGDRQPRR